jgi:hypothetical protein
MSEFEDWLEQGLDESLAKAKGVPEPAPAAAPEAPKKPKSLSSLGIGKGGIIRNPNTKRRTMTDNPVANPQKRKPTTPEEPTEEDELKANNPALAIPTMLTGMDLNTKNGTPEPEPIRVLFSTTVGELIQMAREHGGNISVANKTCTLEVQLPVGKSAGSSPRSP